MKKIILSSLIGYGAIALLSAYSGTQKSAGAPAGHAGAPTEMTCAKSNCHAGVINSGPGVLSIEVEGANGTYQPGREYIVEVSITENATEKFGFQAIAVADADSMPTGAMFLMQDVITQFVTPTDPNNLFFGRTYITHTIAGNTPDSSGAITWSYTWKAPDSTAGDITFYAAGVAANKDENEAGDNVYTNSLTLSPTTGIKKSFATTDVQVFPNPFYEKIMVETADFNKKAEMRILFFDIQGKKIAEQEITAEIMEITAPFPAGIYFYKIKSEKQLINTGKLISKGKGR